MEAEFRPIGDISRIGRILTQSLDHIDELGEEIAQSNSEIYHKALIDNISGQKLSWKPLTPGYLAGKGILGLDTRVLIATGEYLNNIDVRKVKQGGDKIRYHVGVDPDATHSSGINMGFLALILEYGTSDGRIPARSHYGETWSQVRKQVRDNCLKYGRQIWRTSN